MSVPGRHAGGNGAAPGGARSRARCAGAPDHEKIRTREAIENVSFHGPAREAALGVGAPSQGPGRAVGAVLAFCAWQWGRPLHCVRDPAERRRPTLARCEWRGRDSLPQTWTAALSRMDRKYCHSIPGAYCLTISLDSTLSSRVICVADGSPAVQADCSGSILLFGTMLCWWLCSASNSSLQETPIGIAIDQ